MKKMIRISISINEDDWIELQKIADQKRISASAMIRLLISENLQTMKG